MCLSLLSKVRYGVLIVIPEGHLAVIVGTAFFVLKLACLVIGPVVGVKNMHVLGSSVPVHLEDMENKADGCH